MFLSVHVVRHLRIKVIIHVRLPGVDLGEYSLARSLLAWQPHERLGVESEERKDARG